MRNIDMFIESFDKKNTAKVAKHVLKRMPANFEYLSSAELCTTILDMSPKSEKEIATICYELRKYAKWLIDQDPLVGNTFWNEVQKIDKKQLWKMAKPNAEQKFISHNQYKETIQKIIVSEKYNPLYYEVLFSSIYEGLYCDDLSVLKNLRSADIDETVVTLHEDSGKTYRIRISQHLSTKLKTLAAIDTWKRPNPYGICTVNMDGLFMDSVFKVERRKTQSEKSRKFPYYSRLRKIKEDYAGVDLSPLQIYISGIVHRVKYLLAKNGITLEQAFADNSRNHLAYQLISQELQRCNSIIEIANFREMIKGHIDLFSEDSTEDISDQLFADIPVELEQEMFLEGEEIILIHHSHERNSDVVNLAKKKFKESHSGRVYCECCGFDFYEHYGTHGAGFIEAHHTKPLSTRNKNEPTRVVDIVLLCSNCHSMIHFRHPWLKLDDLKKILNKSGEMPHGTINASHPPDPADGGDI